MNEHVNDAKRYRKKIRGNLLINSIVYIVYLLAAVVFVVCMWSKTTFNVGLNEILITLAGPLDGTGGDTLSRALMYCVPRVFLIMSIITAFYVYVYIRAGRLTKKAFTDVKPSIFSLLRYLTVFNDIPLMMADRVL